MSKTYRAHFNIKNLGLYGVIPHIQEAMQEELIRVYNMYAEKTNSGITEQLNKEFNRLNPGYFKNNQDKEWYDLTEYNRFMADGYQRLFVDELNDLNESPILDFFVNPEKCNFMGCLKYDHNVTIDFYLKEE